MKIPIKKTKAAILNQLNKDLIIDDIDLPERLFKGQILVKLIYSGVCGSQLGEITGIKGPDNYLPHLLGHEGIAQVIAIGSGVKKVKANDHVLLHWMPSSEKNSQTPVYSWKGKKLNAGFVTTFNNYAVISQNRCSKISSNKKNFLNIMLLGCTASTAIGTVKKSQKIKQFSNILVTGCGSIGIYIIQYLRYLGCKNIYALDLYKSRLLKAKSCGAKYLLNSLNKFKQLKFDAAFETTGNTNLITKIFDKLKSNGEILLIGVPKYKTKASFNTLEINLGKKIIGSKGGDFDPLKDLCNYKKIVCSKKCSSKKIITNLFFLKDINKALKKLKNGTISGKAVIKY
jgi:S-(hydroxymethyl)glutathione dehydrogenase/alcohol dehydrogenase